MSENNDIDRFVKDPSLLVELCRELIDQLDAGPDDAEVGEREAQLREISKTIERLEKACISVPDVLRGEKTRLAAASARRTDVRQTLSQLADEFDNILKDLKSRLVQDQPAGALKPRAKRSGAPKTGRKVLREYIISALLKLGGSARGSDVIEEMGRQLEGKLMPGDMEWREATNDYAWQNNAKWERYQMTQDGALRSGSPRGIWELGEDTQ